MQDIRISYTADTSGLKAAVSGLDKLNKEERELLANTNKAAAAGAKQGDAFAKGAKQGADNVSGLNKRLDGLAGGIASAFAVGAVVAFGAKVIEVTGQTQKLRAVLENQLGEEAGRAAFGQLQQFAATTNFSLLEVTDSFNKLVGAGIKPTNAELTKLADLANSKAKSLDQLTEAIIDAQTGEFERLKEFGVRAEKDGDRVRFTFKGITTEVSNTSSSIRDYIFRLGELNGIQGSTQKIAQTLEGQLSNLGDATDKFLSAVGNFGSASTDGLIPFLATIVSGAADAVEALDKITDSLEGLENLNPFRWVEEAGKAVEEQNNLSIASENAARFLSDYEKADRKTQEALKEGNKLLQEQVRLQKLVGEEYSILTGKFTGRKLSEEELRNSEITLEETKIVAQGIKDIEERRFADAKANEDARLKQLAEQREKEAKEREKLLKELESFRQKYIGLTSGLDLKAFEAQIDVNAAGLGEDFALVQQQRALTAREAVTREFDKTRDEVEKIGKRLVANGLLSQADLDASLQRLDDTLKARIAAINAKIDSGELQIKSPLLDNPDLIKANNQKAEEENERFLNRIGEQIEDFNEKNRERDKAELERLKEKEAIKREIQQESFDLFANLGSALFEINGNRIEGELQKVREVEASKLAIVGDNEQAQRFIKEETNRKERELQRKQAINARNAALFEVGIRTAMGVASVLSTGGGTYYSDFGVSAGILTALVIAQGALQAALILSKPIPSFKSGVLGLEGPGTETSDSIMARLSKGESVMTAKQTREYYPTLKAIREGMVSPQLLNEVALGRIPDGRAVQSPEYRMLAFDLSAMTRKYDELLQVNRTQAKELGRLKIVNISMDENGFQKHIQQGDAKTVVLNKQFPV